MIKEALAKAVEAKTIEKMPTPAAPIPTSLSYFPTGAPNLAGSIRKMTNHDVQGSPELIGAAKPLGEHPAPAPAPGTKSDTINAVSPEADKKEIQRGIDKGDREIVSSYLQKKTDAIANRRGVPRMETKAHSIPGSAAAYYQNPGWSYYWGTMHPDHAGSIGVDYAPDRLAVVANALRNAEEGKGQAAVEQQLTRSRLDFDNDSFGHEMAHADPHNPYGRSNIIKRLAPNGNHIEGYRKFLAQRAANAQADRKYKHSDSYFTRPGIPMDEVRAVMYGYTNRLYNNPGGFFRNPLPDMRYANQVTAPIRDSFTRAWYQHNLNKGNEAHAKEYPEDKAEVLPRQREYLKERNKEIVKGRHYIARLLYPHLGSPNNVDGMDLNTEPNNYK